MHRLLAVLFLVALAKGNNFNQQVRAQNRIKNDKVINLSVSHIGKDTTIFK